MTHDEYIKRRDEIFYALHGVKKGDVPFVDRSIEAAGKAIDALVLAIVDYDVNEWADNNPHYGVEKEVRYEVQTEQRSIVKGGE